VQLSNEDFAARRARWLAELALALGEARRLMREVAPGEARVEAMELCAQIDALRHQIDAMQLGRRARNSDNFDPEWMNSPWRPLDPAPPKSGTLQVDA
jgi:hypothetical protein